MKLSTILASVLALSTPALGWDCTQPGGGGRKDLEQIHGDFNRLFGAPRLRAASHQCYAAVCRGLTFGFCNRSGVTQWEVSGDRDVARNTDPGPGGSCALAVQPVEHPYHIYIYGKADKIGWYGRNYDVRYC